MAEVILHHYPMSPYAEKVRKALGIKRLAWRSVTIPVIMPKPDLMPLTGGYRKTPVMQIGADIYCDTQCILRELERRFPEPSLYRGTDAGTANALSFYLDRTMFSPIVGMVFGLSPRALPEGFAEDRTKMMGRELNLDRLKAAVPMLLDQLRPQFAWLEAMLVDGRAFLCGEHPTLVDCSAHHLCWFISSNVSASTPPLGELPKLHAWIQRMARIGHGQPTELSSQEALAIAKAATPQVEERRRCERSVRPQDRHARAGLARRHRARSGGGRADFAVDVRGGDQAHRSAGWGSGGALPDVRGS